MINFAPIIGQIMSYFNNAGFSLRKLLTRIGIINVFLLRKIFHMEQYLLLC
jgi:hypothetical protein